MRLVALVVACALSLILWEDGDGAREVSALPLLQPAQRTQSTGLALSPLRRRMSRDLAEEPSLCFSVRENEEQWQLLCNERRSKFNFNPLSLRFGKRYVYRRALKRARSNRRWPLHLFSRELEVKA